MSNRLTILFHSATENTAGEIARDLTALGLSVQKLSEKDFGYNLLALAEAIETPVLLLLSYNWLRDTRTLFHVLPAIKLLVEKQLLLVSLIPGFETDDAGKVKEIPTNIERVKDIIPYMKYWQEAFISARLKRNDADTPIHQQEEQATKAISLNFGDIMAYFKELNPISLDQVKRSNYQIIFDSFALTPAAQPTGMTSGSPVAGDIRPPENNPTSVRPESSSDEQKTITVPENTSPVPGDDQDTVSLQIPDDVAPPPTAEDEKDFTTGNSEDRSSDDMEYALQSNIEEEATSTTETASTGAATATTTLRGADAILDEVSRLFDEGKDDEAFKVLEEAIPDAGDDSTTLRYHYAFYLAQRRNAYDEAFHQLDTILLTDPQNANAYFLLAELAELQGNYALAYRFYREVRKIQPDFPQINYRIGIILQDQYPDAEKEAARFLKKALIQDPENVDALYRLGMYTNDYEKKPEEAIEYFERVLKLDPGHSFANYDLALIYHNLGDKEKAAAYYRRACENNPEIKTEQNDLAFLKPLEEAKTATATIEEGFIDLAAAVQIKTILITGATSGIGLAITEKLAAAGHCRLILTGRRRNRLQQIVEAVKDTYGIAATFLQFDIRDVLSVKEAIGTLQAPFDQIDVLINNAGLALGLSSIFEGRLSDWETMIDTNIKGLLYVTREITPTMVERRSGQIINIGSIAGKEAYPNGNVYNATKAAVDMLTKAMRLDLHKYHIRVGQVAPGHVETEFALNRFHGDAEKAKIYEDFTPLTPSDVAEIVLFMIRQPAHVNIQDVLVLPTQQASANIIDRSGKLNTSGK